jgi:Ca2+/H+ antiporter
VARDTVFAAIMIVLNGILGLCLLVGGIRYHRQSVQAHSATAALGVLGTLAVLALVLPNYTTSTPGPLYAPAQLIFVAVVSLALYGFFLHAQTVRHRDDFHDPVGDDAGHALPEALFHGRDRREDDRRRFLGEENGPGQKSRLAGRIGLQSPADGFGSLQKRDHRKERSPRQDGRKRHLRRRSGR